MIVGFLAMLLLMQMSACASVDVVRLTNATFSPNASVEDVEVLEQEPTRPHVRLAKLHIDDASLSFARMQERLLTKAASLGADAVVFAKPVRQIEHQVTYAPVYDPWGYDSPFYGPGEGYGASYGPWAWGGYGGSMALPYDLEVEALSGTAIRYTGSLEAVSK
jgi:hypothetical protein